MPANQLLSGNNSRFLRQGARLLCGKKQKAEKCATDDDSINHVFIHLSNYSPLTFVQGEGMPVSYFSREEKFDILGTINRSHLFQGTVLWLRVIHSLL